MRVTFLMRLISVYRKLGKFLLPLIAKKSLFLDTPIIILQAIFTTLRLMYKGKLLEVFRLAK